MEWSAENKKTVQSVSRNGTDWTEERERIRESALRILEYADNTVGDLRRKLLKKGYQKEQVDEVIINLEKAGLLNDTRFAEQYVRIKTEAGKGPAWIRQKLLQKGVARNAVDQALMDVSDRSSQRARCLVRALELCCLGDEFDVGEDGSVVPSEESLYIDRRAKVFEKTVRNESNRVNLYREKEKAKAKMARRLTAAGFSADAVMYAVRMVEDL